MNPRILLGAAVLAMTGCADPEAEFLNAWNTIEADDLAHHIQVLASDEFEGRAPGTEGEEKTLRYLEQAFAEAGANPAVDGQYRQAVPLVELKRSGTPRFSVRDAQSTMRWVYERDFAAFAGRPSERSDLRDLPIVFAGFGASAEEHGWDDYAGVDVTGAAVLLLRGEPSSETDSTLFRGRALTKHGMTPTKYDNAARLGAKAAIVVHTDSSAGFPWSIMSSGGIGATQNFLEDDLDKAKLDVVVHINEAAARKMLARAGRDLDALMASANRADFRAEPLPLRTDMTFEAETRHFVSYNVVAMVEGRTAPDEVILYTAHWDHVGRNDTLEGDQIFNGAIDNATGTAALIELAHAYAALPRAPRRTVFFVATTAEEKGLLGSEYMARKPIIPLERTIAVLNLDALFPFGPFDAMTVPALGSSEVEDVLADAAARLGRRLQDVSNPEVGAYYRSDHYPFAKRGVPAVFAVGGPRTDIEPDSLIVERFTDYLSNGYHKPADEYDPEWWDLSGVEGDVRIMFETGWRLADGTEYPNWHEGNEFRALRDAMR